MNNPNTHPAPAMVYGGAPSFQDADHALSTAADLAERMAMADELATLRADNDARGVMIEQLRAELDKAERTINAMAVRLDIANTETERQQRLTALFVRVLREMTPGAE